MHSEPLDFVPLWALLPLELALLWIVMEVGYRIGKWRHAHMPDERDQPVGAMVASILGLVALVLGFTFSLAASRFDARRLGVLEEANAIGTCYLRTRLLPAPEHVETSGLLREYVDVRLAGIAGRSDEAIARSNVLHELLWSQASSAAEKSPNPITGLFVESLNDVIDMHAKRLLVGIHSRIPIVIWIGIFGLSLLGVTAVGYQAGLTTTRRSPVMLALVLAFGIVLILIADLDRGQEGLLRISQHPLLDLQKSMQADVGKN
jgi:hypothetical protein